MYYTWVQTSATLRIRLNDPCAAAMRSYVKLLWTLVNQTINKLMKGCWKKTANEYKGFCLRCCDTVGWACENWVVLVWLSVWSEVQTVCIWSSWCHCHPKTPSSVASFKPTLVFTARCYASAVLAMALCLSVRLSVTSRCSTKTAKRMITLTTPHDSPGTLVFWSQRSRPNSTGVTPCGGAKYRWDGSKSATFDK